MEKYDSNLSSVIDSALGLRCISFGYIYTCNNAYADVFQDDFG